jgi:saccharopine dehydrogenase (NAD+, L-glutamate forming)
VTDERAYDVVLVGATGFTGRLSAEYLARHLPDGARWALAGRDAEKLAGIRAGLGPGGRTATLLTVNLTDHAAVADVAASTRVLATTAGPYLVLGRDLAAACAEAGTDYLDLAGEPEFVDRVYLDSHEHAVATGARLVHSCGFDSIPHDMGAYFTVSQLPDDLPISLAGYVRAKGSISGGTYRSALNSFARIGAGRAAAKERKRREKRPSNRRARAVPGKPHRVPGGNLWAAPLPTIDPVVVARSARALPEYGPDFTYSHYAVARHVTTLAVGALAVGAVVGLAQIPPAKRFLMGRMPSGSGPPATQRAKSWFKVRFVGQAGTTRIVTQVSGPDPGYVGTAAMLGESAICLAFDDLSATSGQVTTAVAMGQRLIDRLVGAGFTFEVLSA